MQCRESPGRNSHARLRAFGPERHAMEAHHVRVHAVGVNQAAAHLAGNSAREFCKRLLQPRFGSSLSCAPGFVGTLLARDSFPTAWRPAAKAAAPGM